MSMRIRATERERPLLRKTDIPAAAGRGLKLTLSGPSQPAERNCAVGFHRNQSSHSPPPTRREKRGRPTTSSVAPTTRRHPPARVGLPRYFVGCLLHATSYCATLAGLFEFCGCAPAYFWSATPPALNADPGALAECPGVAVGG